MVVGDFRRIEYFFRFFQSLSAQRSNQFRVRRRIAEARLEKAVHRLRTLRVNIVGKIARIDTRIGRDFLFVELLDEVQRHLSRKPEFLVAIDLQRGQIVELRRCFRAFFLLDTRHCKWLSLNELEGFFAFFLRSEFSFRRRESRVAIDRRQNPVRFGFEVVDFLLPIHDERERGRLHPTDAQHLPILAVFQRVEARRVHSEQPVADGAAQSGEVERLIIFLVFQFRETFADGLVGHRRNPKPLHRAFRACFLHHPTLNQLALLTCVAAVDDTVGVFHEFLDDGKLFTDSLIIFQSDAETRWNHW